MTPTEMGELVDQYHLAREARLKLQKQVDKLDVIEKKFQQQLIAEMIREKVSSIGGNLRIGKLDRKDKPICQDWPKLYLYIGKNDAFDLLHKRITEEAVNTRTEEGIIIPGITFFPTYKIILSNPSENL